ncbi:hypothetical protein LSM04_005759 [Trypanosoma melophagium]|uniref:uncharacterized protein n=1 Tax=Trypanosoma melophagium TaxID=715481 RepID=UPI00351A844D|nr:hypothetical protein LSM04_005759 [Trypanosoma melophagium]
MRRFTPFVAIIAASYVKEQGRVFRDTQCTFHSQESAASRLAKAAPVAPEPPKAAPAAPEPPKAAPVAPEPPKAAPVAPEPPKAAPAAPEPPKAAPVAPEPPKAAPVAPEPPKAAPAAPEPPKAAPVAPEPPKAAPVAPEPPKAAPVAPEPPKAAPVAPEPPKAAPVAPEPPKAAPAAPEPPKAAPVAPEPPKAAPVAPEPPKAAPAAPEPPKAAPAAPEPPKAAPAAPEPPKAAPAAPEPPKAAPAAPEPPKAAPVAPEPPKAAPAAPEPPKAAPVAPEPPKAAPAAPEPPKAAPAAPEPPKAAIGVQSKVVSSKGSGLPSTGGHRKREGVVYRERHRTHAGREDRRRNVSRDNLALGNKTNVSTLVLKDKTLRLSNVIDDIGEMKVVFANRSTAKPSNNPLTTNTPPSTPPPPPASPVRIPPPPTPPAPPSAPIPPKVPPPSSGASETLQHVRGSAGASNVGSSSVSHDVEDDIFFTIAPPTESRDIREATWAKSIGLSLDEEIEKARASRPLVRSPEVARSRDEKIRLNVVSVGNSGENSVILDKSTLKPLSQEEEAMIDRHEIPDVISERVDTLDQEEIKHPFNKGEGTLSNERSDKKIEEMLSSFTQQKDEKVPSSSCKRSSPCEDNDNEITMSVELPPLASWTTTEPSGDDQEPCVKVSFEKKNGKQMATIILQRQPTCITSVIKALHQAITAIEDYYKMDDSVIYVLLTTLPTLNFFETRQGMLELSCPERVELLREKERLLTRLASTPQRLCFISVAYAGVVGDLGAELFLTCHHRFLLEPVGTTFGFPSLHLGDFPTPRVVRQLAHCFGSQRAIEMVPRLHEYRTDSLIDAGLVRCAHSVQEVLAMLTNTTISFGGGAEVGGISPSLLLWLERKLLMIFSRPDHKTLLLRKLFFTRRFEKSMVVAGPNPLLQAWVWYSMAAITQEKRVDGKDKIEMGQTHSESIFSEMTYSAPAINAANVYALERKMERRVVMPLPGGTLVTFRHEEMPLWSEKMKAVLSASDDVDSNNSDENSSGTGTVTVVLDCSRRCLEATTRLVSEHRTALRGVCVVLVGPVARALPLLALLPFGAIVSPAGPFARLQELRLFARTRETPPAARCRQLTAAAAAFLQAEHRPVVACRGSCGRRLVAAIAAAACRVAGGCGAGGIARVDGVAVSQRLGMRVGPFRLIDSCGADAVLRMMHETHTMNEEGNPLLRDNIPAVAQNTLQYMSTDGFLGAQARRGGFYTYHEDGTPIGPNPEVQERYLRRRLTDAEIADILLAVVVNECCEMLLTGRVQCAEDANMLTMAAIGFHEITGGALAMADAKGIGTMVQTMEDLAEWHGSHLLPSSLLKCMAHSNVSFASLSEATIQSARM